MIVMKFGGTSNQDARAMANVAGIIARHRGERPVVVISAIAQATNMLERAAMSAAEGKPEEARRTLHALFDRHGAILDGLVAGRRRRGELRTVMAGSLRELEEMVTGVAILREMTPRTLDSFCAFGELLSSRLVAAALQERGIPSRWIDTKDFMLTDDNHSSALPVMDAVEARLGQIVRPLARKGIVPVTQGFIGVNAAGHRTTMGRESSDFSAAIIGAALGVKEIQIWTDVDGILSADPRVVDNPKKVKVLSAEEAFELSYFGAKVLHPNTMLPALGRNIPVRILNSRRPRAPGTVIGGGQQARRSSSRAAASASVKSIASKEEVTLLELGPRTAYSQYIFWEHIYSVLARYGVRAHLAGSSEYHLALVVDTRKLSDGLLNDLGAVGAVRRTDGKGILSLVGRNLPGSPELLGRLFRSLSGFSISFVSYGPSKSTISLVVGGGRTRDLVRKLHDEFFGSPAAP